MAEEEEEAHSSGILRVNISLSGNILNSLRGGTENNAVFTPLTVHTLLSVLSQDPTYHSRSNFKSLLYLHNNDVYIKCYEDFISFFRTFNNDILLVTNKLFVKDDRALQHDFKTLINHFHYEIDNVDFSKKEISAKIGDSFVSNKTKGIIRDFISFSSLTDRTQLAMLNTVHFKGKWNKPFTLEANPMKFYLNDSDSVQTQMMKVSGEFYYKVEENYNVEIIELPFSEDDFSLVIVLPGKACDTRDLLNRVWWCLEEVETDTNKAEVEVVLPKFQIEQLLNSKSILSDLELKEEFEDMNLFGILEGGELLNYAQMDQKEFITVDEQGAKAASGLAATLTSAKLDEEIPSPNGLKMSEMNVNTVISNRFSKTLITCKVQNNNKSPQEATFAVVLPEAAFITEFVMEIGGKAYKSYIKEKAEAKAIYEEALTAGKSAGIVEADTRDSTRFNVSVNLEPQSVAHFSLTYEEMLRRVHDQYELILNISPGQVVDYINVEVKVNESRPLKFVKTPPLRSGKEMIDQKTQKYLVPSSDIKMINANSSVVKFTVDAEKQRQISCYLGMPMLNGFSGQFVVQYDVKRDPKDGEILLQDGYFVHFFAPNDLDPLPKHVIFVLDTSGSMHGRKMNQLKDAMMSILSDIRKGDLMSIIEFDEDVVVWDINSLESKRITCNDISNFMEPFGVLSEFSLPSPTFADDLTISKAKTVVQNLCACGSTFIIGGLEIALYMIKVAQEKIIDSNSKYQPIMVFLTDGFPNVGSRSPSDIVRMVTQLNLKHNKAPIFSLSFGDGADKSFLRKLSLKNYGFARHIYEASDASLQLQSFYKQISSPLLADIKFKYDSDVTEVTRSFFPIYFGGCELVVAGRCKGCNLSSTINGCGPRGPLYLGSIIKNPVTSLERMWAYLTVKQLLEERNAVEKKEELTKRAVSLALKYSFVTEVTSLVVVKPDENCDTGAASTQPDNLGLRGLSKKFAGCPKKMCIRKRVIKKCIGGSPQEIEIVSDEEESQGSIEDPEETKIKQVTKLQFLANHPFLMVLTVKKGDRRIILFVGWVYKPSS